jgi:hypothetical protein
VKNFLIRILLAASFDPGGFCAGIVGAGATGRPHWQACDDEQHNSHRQHRTAVVIA